MAKNAVDALLESAGSIPAAAPAADFKPPLPKTKGEVGKLSSEQMDTLVEVHELGMPSEWGEASSAEKHKMLNVKLGFVVSKKTKKEKEASDLALAMAGAGVTPVPVDVGPVGDEDPEDDAVLPPSLQSKAKTKTVEPNVGTPENPTENPIMMVAQEIEGLKDQASIESEITTLLSSEGMNDFRLGGLMLKLLEVGTFPDNSTFKDYIGARWGIKYRKARYLIELYNGLLKSGIPWEAVAGIGWSKVITLLPVLTTDNVAEWVEKAKQYNNDTLQATVKAALAGEGGTNPKDANLEQSKLKTLTFGVGPDQEELIKEAVEHAMGVGQTEHKGVALELICTEYLGNTTSKTAAPKKAPAPAAHEHTSMADVEDMIAAALTPINVFKHFLAKANGDIPTAMGLLFGEDFDAVFPGVNVSIDIEGPNA